MWETLAHFGSLRLVLGILTSECVLRTLSLVEIIFFIIGH